MYFLRYCLLLTIFTLFFYILTLRSDIENFSQLKRFNKNNILQLKGKLFKNFKNNHCNSQTPSPSLIQSNCILNKKLHTINPCYNNCKTFKAKGNLYQLSYENRPIEKLSPFTNKHFGDIGNKKISNILINDEDDIQSGEDIIIPSKIGNKDISELGHCLDNCCNQIIGSKSGNVWDKKRSIFDKEICKETYKREIKPEVNMDIFSYIAGGKPSETIFQYKPKNCEVLTY